MSNILRQLDPDGAYIYCPACRNQGNPTSPLRREMHMLKCSFGHQWDTTKFASLAAQRPEMTPMSDMLIEQPPETAVAWKIHIIPEYRQQFELKFAGRVHATLNTLIAALCSDSVIFVDGEAAAKLKQRGLGNGASIVQALESMDQMERERDEAVSNLSKLMSAVQAAQGNG